MNNNLPGFTCNARWAARAAGSPLTLITAVVILLIWCITGPFFGFGGTWQLVINTGMTLITFLLICLIQATVNREKGDRSMRMVMEEGGKPQTIRKESGGK